MRVWERGPRTAIMWSVLGLVTAPLVGCGGIELVRSAVEPPALEVAPVEERIETAALITASADDPRGCAGGALAGIATQLRAAGPFSGGALTAANAGAADAACELRFAVTDVSEPVIYTIPRSVIGFFCYIPPWLTVPVSAIWTDREPELACRGLLDVFVRGETAVVARYEALAHGTICAQTETSVRTEHWQQLADLAAKSLVTRFASDEATHARLRAQLSDEPGPELEPLLVTEERDAGRARWRTRKLIAWKNESLGARVAEAKTSELRALVSRLETCMLDLTHEAEVEKDAAQTFTAAGADADAQGKREVSLAYRERVEVLRPILTAVKEELDGRAR